MKYYNTMLTIAGSDPSGGAGIQADIKTATALGVYAMSVITAVTAQNTTGVFGYKAVGGDLLASQLRAVFDDVRPDAVKIGMIPDGESAGIIADFIEEYRPACVVLDPVAVATSRDALTSHDAPAVVARRLFGLSSLITPNVSETALYLGVDSDDVVADIPAAGAALLGMGAKAVLITGGDTHVGGDITDVFMCYGCNGILEAVTSVTPYVDTANTHGTGCSLSSAIASFVALGCDLRQAVAEAQAWIHQAIVSGAGYSFGHGHGPINHIFQIAK